MQKKSIRLSTLAIAFVAAASLAFSGCSKSSDKSATAGGASGGKKKLYWVQTLKGHPVHQMTQIGFTEGAHNLGYDAVIVGTDAVDIPQTIALAEEAINSGDVSGMAIWTGNPSYLTLMSAAKQKGIPVILPHFPVPQDEAPDAAGVISCDPAEYAVVAAEKIGAKINGKGSVAITQGSFNSTENMVAKKFKETMAAKYPNVKVLDPLEEGFDTTAAAARATSVILANPDLTAALSTSGGGPLAWSTAARDASKKDLVIVGMDYTRVNLDLIKSGEVYAVIGQPLWEESTGAAKLLDDAIKGQKVDWWTKLEAPFITKDDLAPHYELLDKVEKLIKK